MATDPLTSQRRAQLGVIRVALLAGVLAFGAVTWWTHQGLGYRGPAMPPGGRLGTVAYVVDALAIVGSLLMRRLAFATADPARYGTRCVLAWAMGEAAALTGGVYYFMTNDMSRYLLGVLVMLLAFVLVPLRRA